MKGFYSDNVHKAEQIPADAAEIAAEEHEALLAARAAGKVITPGKGGRPVAADPPGPSPEEVAAHTRAEVKALADVILALTGTDPEKAAALAALATIAGQVRARQTELSVMQTYKL